MLKTPASFYDLTVDEIRANHLYHNYFREHDALDGKTPAEMANIKIEGRNKWITVIQNASKPTN